MTTNEDLAPNAQLLVPLTVGQAIALARLVRQAANKVERRAARSTFVPEPGRRDMARAHLARLDLLLDALFDALGIDELVDDPRRNGVVPARSEAS